MAEKNKYPYKGEQVPGESVAFTTLGENWSIYKLADGSELKVKLVMMDVVRLDVFEDGKPVYMFGAQQVVGLTPNPELMQKAN
ncbi:MAG: hypothetical protein JST61_16430 [Acidobacteria bacterium]|nr:hypothetical protein [Acidobacteriota bacterium]